MSLDSFSTNSKEMIDRKDDTTMSKLITGDIARVVQQGAILHQVNCQKAMGSGVALALLKKWRAVRDEYLAFRPDDTPQERFGHLQAIHVTPAITVYNSYSQLDFGTYQKQTDEAVLIHNIQAAADIERAKDGTLYVPYLVGCGLAGGDWDTVYNGIKDIDNLVIVKYES